MVLVLHSYGGIPGSDAAETYSKSERMAKGLCGGVVRVVWISAFACDVGESMLDKVAGNKSSNFVQDDVSLSFPSVEDDLILTVSTARPVS